DDLPQDAEFLGQEKEEPEGEDFLPLVEEELLKTDDELDTDLSTQEQIKEELAELDELDKIPMDHEHGNKVLEEFKDEPILNEEELGISDEEVDVPDLEVNSQANDFDDLKESEIQRALGEEVSVEEEEVKADEPLEQNLESETSEELEVQTAQVQNSNNNEEIVNEISQSIAQSITSSIKDDTLKAALKGMNMNINIKISFDENK
ncbi:MAG: hypothetical protein J1D99_05955, partial [Campylobacter sp.]|nr:hypothetical protein [Campylobacter sp.]